MRQRRQFRKLCVGACLVVTMGCSPTTAPDQTPEMRKIVMSVLQAEQALNLKGAIEAARLSKGEFRAPTFGCVESKISIDRIEALREGFAVKQNVATISIDQSWLPKGIEVCERGKDATRYKLDHLSIFNSYANVTLDMTCGGLCGVGEHISLQRRRGVWTVTERMTSWMS